jgi:hypothetical protein
MIIITGLPRSGTSLMMRILESLSIPITGEKFFNQTDNDRKERSQYLNPEGFYEIQDVVSSGKFKDPEKFLGSAIKVVVPGVMNVAVEHIEKIIFCLRNPSEVIESQRYLISGIEVATDEGKKYSAELLERNFTNYIRSMGVLILSVSDEFWNKTLVVQHQNLMSNPCLEIQKISHFLGVSFVNANIVDQNLYRIKPIVGCDPLALEIYECIKTKDFLLIKDKIKKYFQELIRKDVCWVDEDEFKTFVLSNLSLHKTLVTNNKGVRDKLLKTSKQKKHYFDCQYYSRNGEEYTIKRIDLPDLVRPKVTCSYHKKEQTLEFCHQCFMTILLRRISK